MSNKKLKNTVKYIINLDFLTKPLIIRMFLLLIMIAMIKRLFSEITDELIIGLFVYVSGLISFNLVDKKIKSKKESKK